MTELPLKFPASWKCLLDIMGLKAENECPNDTEELWVTVQAAIVIVIVFHYYDKDIVINIVTVILA